AQYGYNSLQKGGHIGLQQLSALAATGRMFLGPNKTCKFVVDESTYQTALTSSAFRLLDNLDLTSGVGQLLNETVQAHHKAYKTGTSSLLFLVGAWSKAILECLNQGLPFPILVAVMSEGLESCIEAVKTQHILIKDIFKKVEYENENSKTLSANDLFKPCSSYQPKVHPILMKPLLPIQQQKSATPTSYPLQSFLGAKDSSVDSVVQSLWSVSLSLKHGSGFRTASFQRKPRLFHSRHLMTPEESQDEGPCSSILQEFSSASATRTVELTCIRILGEALSHGNKSAMKLVTEAYKLQHPEAFDAAQRTLHIFNVNKVVTCCLPGLSENHSSVSSGYVTLVSTEKAAVVKRLQDKDLQILLISGDMTEKYRHLGFDGPSNMKTVAGSFDGLEASLEEEWLNVTTEVLSQFHIKIVMVKGMVSPNLVEKCVSLNILLISCVKDNVLEAFAEATGAVIMTYVTQVKEYCVGHGVRVDLWRTDNDTVEINNQAVIQIKATEIPLITAVISSHVISKLWEMEDQFWTCAYRLHHALSEQQVFPGAGSIELYCLHHLLKLQKLDSTPKADCNNILFPSTLSWVTETVSLYRPIVLQALANGWTDYLSTVMFNTGMYLTELEARLVIQHHLQNAGEASFPPILARRESIDWCNRGQLLDVSSEETSTAKVYDNVTAKLEAWRRSLDLVLLVLQTDTEIVTGSRTKPSVTTEEVTFL
uniref:Bardet-Biedl syndrome 12 n=2 Tax=Latimeria chalumnae TaxID=7897 RepID=H2ZVG5_LATCH